MAGAVIGGVASVAGGVIGAKGAKKAAKAQVAGQQAAIEEQRRQFDVTRQDFQPYQQAGAAALNKLADPAAFTASPGYGFARDQALDAVKTQQNALGRLASGNTLAALEDRATGLASQEFGNWFNQQSGLAGMGLSATGNLGSLGANNAANIGNLLAGQGAARAGGYTGAADAWGNALSDIGGFLGYGMKRQAPQGGNGGGIAPDLRNGLAGLNIAPNAVNQVPQNLLAYRDPRLRGYGG